MQGPQLQAGLTVTKYDELGQFCDAFARENYDLLTIVGPGGTGKSETVTRKMNAVHGGTDWSLIKGKHTALDLYLRLYHSRLQPIVLDDIDSLLANSDNTAILKCICETKRVKRVEWGSLHPAFRDKKLAVPKSFDSVSRVCVVANDLGRLNQNIQALLTRGACLDFRPTAIEVHREVARGGWFEDEEVFDFIGEHLWLMTRPNMRFYIITQAHKRAGMAWRELALRALRNDADEKSVLVAELLADLRFDSLASPENERAKAFSERGGGSRATYFRQKASLLVQRGEIDLELAKSIRLGTVCRDAQWYSMREREEHLLSLRQRERQNNDENQVRAIRNQEESGPSATVALQNLRLELENAIKAEDFERAVELRDEIRRLESP